MVPTASGVADRPPMNATDQERPSATEREVGHGVSTSFKAGTLGDDYIRAALHGSELPPSFVMPGEREPNSNTRAHCVDGESFVAHGKSIPLFLL